MSAFWDAWRKDIIRGAALFVAVLAVGLCVRYLVVRVRQGVTDRLPMALRDLRDNFDPELLAGARDTGEAGKGDSLEVRAVKTYRRSDPASVRLVAVPYEGGVSICAVWKHGEGGCGPGEEVKQGSAHGSDVAVAFR